MPFLVGWANYFARRTQPRGDFETNSTSAAADAGQRETAITTAHPRTATVETGDTSAAADAGHRETAITTATTDAGQRETAITTAHPSTATVETGDTSAAADAGQRETAITTAHPSTATVETDNTSATEKHAKNTHFSPAKAMTVSTCPRHRPAKATRVSTRRK